MSALQKFNCISIVRFIETRKIENVQELYYNKLSLVWHKTSSVRFIVRIELTNNGLLDWAC